MESLLTWRESLETIQFEGIKTGLKQSKDGYILTVAVHPDDLPDDLMRDFVGARYMVVMVRLADDEKPMVREKRDPIVSMAGMLCRDPSFWEYIVYSGDYATSEEECIEWIKDYFNIDSRTDFKVNEKAKKDFLKFKEGFDAWKK